MKEFSKVSNAEAEDIVDLKLSAKEVKKYSEEDILSNLDYEISDDKVVKLKSDKLIRNYYCINKWFI